MGVAKECSRSGRGAEALKMTVVDASVYVALVNPSEPAHRDCWRWYLESVRRKALLTAPTIILAEVAAALSRGLDDRELAHKAASRLQRSRGIRLVPVTDALAHQAAKIAADYRIRGCDSIYLALAEANGADLITLDRQQLERGSAIVVTRQPS